MPISVILCSAVRLKSKQTQMALSVFRKAPRFWERRGPTSLVLWPLSWLYGMVLRIRKLIQDLDIGKTKFAPVPIIIVGNIRVGGIFQRSTSLLVMMDFSTEDWHAGRLARVGVMWNSLYAMIEAKVIAFCFQQAHYANLRRANEMQHFLRGR